MKTATYTRRDGSKFNVEYDEKNPCVVCGLPIIEASTSGTNLCPWCDCGMHRDGTKWTYQEAVENLAKWNRHVASCKPDKNNQ